MNKLFILLLSFLLSGCHASEKKVEPGQHIVVKKDSVHQSLFFTGTIEPLQENAITSPIDSVIESMRIHYGEMVHKGDIILTLSSSELQKLYNDTLTDYLKAKDNFSTAKMKFNGTQQLWDAGLISKNNYLSEKSNLDSARVTWMQASRKLSDMLDKMDDPEKEKLSDLSMAEFDKVQEALTHPHNQIHLRAPADGILLYPPKSQEDKATHPAVGSVLKAGQVFALVGDISGVRVQIDVPEMDIAAVHPGMKARISALPLGQDFLEGELLRINAQALNGGNGSVPTFSAVVIVQKLTATEQSQIKVGMSAQIELMIDSKEGLWIPVAAVFKDHQKTMVKILDAQGQQSLREVVTGTVYGGKVAVLSGLEEGETLIV